MRALQLFGLTLVGSQLALFACATAEDQSGLPTSTGGSSNVDEGGTNTGAVSGSVSSSSGTGGQPGTAGATGSSGSGNTAFGGSNGLPSGGTGGHAGASGSGAGGTLGSAGASGASSAGSNAGGHGGTLGTAGSSGGGAANGGGAGTSTGTGGGLACLAAWQGSTCDTCSNQTQDDHKACSVVLQCYEDNACGPTACGTNDQKCGQNTLQTGSAAYMIANTVYSCLCTGM